MKLQITFLLACASWLLPSLSQSQVCESRLSPTSSFKAECNADVLTCTAWREFRATRPYPYQALYVSQNPTTDQATIVISEPPPVGTPEELVRLVGATLGVSEEKIYRLRYPQGPDGWLEDIAITVPTVSARTVAVPGAKGESTRLPSDLARRLVYLSAALFGTADAAYFDDPDGKERTPIPSVNLKISVAELLPALDQKSRDWVLLGNGRPAQSFEQLISGKMPLAVANPSAGLLALYVPRGTPVDAVRGEFRKFAVGSDHLIGGVSIKTGGLLLVARNRSIPLRDLPPMRFETLRALVASAASPLAQSYERKQAFAGKISAGEFKGWDWAPILLSPQLQDSEFGVLLNIADQMLKSWSECGRIAYAAFDYPAPSTFPFGGVAASEWIRQRTLSPSLVFNWNTRAYATSIDAPIGRIITAAGTGALPVSYIVPPMVDPASLFMARMLGLDKDGAKSASGEASSKGSEYFAALGDPVLARVAQNVFLYQVLNEAQPFRRPARESSNAINRHEQVSSVLRTEAERWIAALPSQDLDADVAQLRQTMQVARLTPAQLAQFVADPRHQDQRLAELQQALSLRMDAVRVLEGRVVPLQEEYDKLLPLYERAFEEECRRLNGELVFKGKEVDRCKYKSSSVAQPKIAHQERLDSLASEIEPLVKEHSALTANLPKEIASFDALWKRNQLADDIAARIRKISSHQDNLDSVFAAVLRGTAATPVQGFVRTPSVVLSRNATSETAVGGHNIDALPWLVQTRPSRGGPVLLPGSGERPTLSIERAAMYDGSVTARGFVSSVPIEPRAPRPIRDALQANGPVEDTFLARLERLGELSDPPPGLLAKAKDCHCDFYIEQAADGTATVVKLKPPPSARNTFGDPALLDALAEGSPGSRYVFSGFEVRRASEIANSVLRKMADEPRLADQIEGAKRMFTDAARSVVEKVLAWRSPRGNVVRVTGDPELMSPRVLEGPHPWPEGRTDPDPIAAMGLGSQAVVAIRFPERSALVREITVSVYGKMSELSLPDSAERSVNRAMRSLTAKNSIEQGVARVVDQIMAENRNVKAVEFQLKTSGRETKWRIEIERLAAHDGLKAAQTQ